MERHSEFPLFIQSAIAIAGFLVVLSLVGWAFQPRSTVQRSSASVSSVRVGILQA